MLPVNLENWLHQIWLGVWPAQSWVMLCAAAALEGPVVSLVSWQPLALIFWIPYFIEGLQNGDILALSFPLH